MEGGIDDDGACILGIVPLHHSNLRAAEIWSDMNLFGWEVVRDLHDLELNPIGRGALLMRLRILADEAAIIQKEKSKPKSE